MCVGHVQCMCALWCVWVCAWWCVWVCAYVWYMYVSVWVHVACVCIECVCVCVTVADRVPFPTCLSTRRLTFYHFPSTIGPRRFPIDDFPSTIGPQRFPLEYCIDQVSAYMLALLGSKVSALPVFSESAQFGLSKWLPWIVRRRSGCMKQLWKAWTIVSLTWSNDTCTIIIISSEGGGGGHV